MFRINIEDTAYHKMPISQISTEYDNLKTLYSAIKEKKLSLSMTRGVPCPAQLDLSNQMFGAISGDKDYYSENGTDCRNYGVLEGLPEARRLFADIMEVPAENVIVWGNSSLNIMYDAVVRAMLFGSGGEPWGKQGKVKFLCPVPGYDRHFSICEALGIEMINVSMTPDGPDMDEVERLVSSDESVKGIWCVPKYSNPDGVIYSDETINRFCALNPAAKDFRIFWDNAYALHPLYEGSVEMPNIFDGLKAVGKENMIYMFASTSKITFAGSGISAFASGADNIKDALKRMFVKTIGPDKLNQLRHVRYLKNIDTVKSFMEKHRLLIKPKFDTVQEGLEKNLSGFARWTTPSGGYFISLYVPSGCAARSIELAGKAGVALTPAGSTYPYKKDPYDSNIRIAPTFPSVDELRIAIDTISVCVKLAITEKLMG